MIRGIASFLFLPGMVLLSQAAIVCLWNNAAVPRRVRFRVKPSVLPDQPILGHLRFAPTGPFLTEKTWESGRTGFRDIEITAAPLEFHILSRTSSRGGFDWLTRADVSAK